MKKLGLIICLLLTVGIFTGCETNPKEEFIEEFSHQQGLNSGSNNYVVDEMTISGEPEHQADFDALAKRFTGSSVEVTYLIDEKSKNLFLDGKADFIDHKLPFTFYLDSKEKIGYVSANTFHPVVDMITEITNSMSTMQVDEEAVNGKYISMKNRDVKKTFGIEIDAFKNLRPQITTYFATLDQNKFKKKDNKISLHVSNKEFRAFLKELAKQEDEDTQEWAKDRLKVYDRASFDVTVDVKKHTNKIKIETTSTKNKVIYKLKATIDQEFKASDQSVNLPNEKVTVPLNDFIEEAKSDPKVKDQDMKKLIDSILADKENIDEAAAESGKRFYRPYLDDKQYQQLVEVLDEIVAENSQKNE